MKNLAILIDRPSESQKFTSLSKELNKLSKAINVVVFYCEPGLVPIKTDFPMMDLVHGYGFQGTVISTDIYTTSVMNNMLCPRDKYFYVWDFEFLYHAYPLEVLKPIFKNKLLARNKIRYDILKSSWHEPECIVEEFNHEKLEQLI